MPYDAPQLARQRARRRPPVEVRAIALPDGVALYTDGAFSVAVRRPTGEVVVRRGRHPPSPCRRRSWPYGASMAAQRCARALRVAALGLRFGHGQKGGALATADVGAQTLVTAAASRYAEPRLQQSLLALWMGTSLAPVLFSTLPLWAAGCLPWASCAPLRVGGLPGALLEGTAALLFVPLYVRLLRLSHTWRRLFAYHGASHQVRAAFAAGLPLRVATARTMHVQQPGCGGSGALAVALLAAAASRLVEAAMPSVAPGWWLFWLRFVALLPAATGFLCWQRSTGVPARCVRRQREARRLTHLGRLWLPVADEPDDGMREVALSALVALLSDDSQHERVARPQMDWRMGLCSTN